MHSEDLNDNEPNNTISSSSNPSSQNPTTENGLRSTQLTETSNNAHNTQIIIPSTQLFTETILRQVELDNSSSLILPTKQSDDQVSSNYLPYIIQRVRQHQLCIDPGDFVIPYTPITMEERLAGTDEVHTTVINTCGMTSLPYTLHDDDPFDSKYPNFQTKLPPISIFFNFCRKR